MSMSIPFAILFLAVGAVITVIVILREKRRREEIESSKARKFESQRKKVLEIMYEKGKKADKLVGMPIRIMKILEEMNIMPKDLQKIYESLQEDQLVHVERDAIYLTDLGEAYVDIYMNRKLK